MTRALFPDKELCFLLDVVRDNRRLFGWVERVNATFVVRV